MNAQLKDVITRMEKELYASNAKFGWFEYKLCETKRQLNEANLHTSSLEEKVCNLDVEAKLQEEVIAQAEDDATNRGINVDFKIFGQLLLEV